MRCSRRSGRRAVLAPTVPGDAAARRARRSARIARAGRAQVIKQCDAVNRARVGRAQVIKLSDAVQS